MLEVLSAPMLSAVPHVVHQMWSGSGDIPPMCWCSSASWRRFAALNEWEYKMWRDADLRALVPQMLHPALWDIEFPEETDMERQRGVMRSCIARAEVLRLYGGLYVDCDLFWLGASIDSEAARKLAPTLQLLSYLAQSSVLVTAGHFQDDAFDLKSRPIKISQTPGTHGWQAGGMAAHYLNNAILAAGVNDSTLSLLLHHLPAFVKNALEQSAAINASIKGKRGKRSPVLEEWRITGPEALNRAVARSKAPILLLPTSWVYPYNPRQFPPPAMNTLASQAVTWGEALKIAPWHAFSRLWGSLTDTLGPQLVGNEPTGRKQCVWGPVNHTDLLSWRLVGHTARRKESVRLTNDHHDPRNNLKD